MSQEYKVPEKRLVAVLLAVALIIGFRGRGASQSAKQETPDDPVLMQWLHAPVDPGKLSPGHVYTDKDRALLGAFIPQPVWPLYFYPGFSMKVEATGNYPIDKSYLAATEANNGKVTLDQTGELHGYSGSGFPFDPQRFSPSDPQIALKVLWDFWYRPAHDNYYMPMQTLLRNAQGKDDRTMEYVATENLNIGQDKMPGGLLLPKEKDVESKMWMSFEKPKDIWETQMVVTKFLDHHKDDEVVVFTRQERRTRRLSAAERIDPWMGTDLLAEDFYGFSGQVPEWKWQYLGRRKILATMNVHTNVDWGGPHGWIPQNASWEVRDCYVLAGTPMNSNDPYGRRVLFIDSQRFWVVWMLGYDQSGQLWKNYQHTLAWSNDYHPSPESKNNPTMRYCHFETNGKGNKILHVGETMVDLKKQEATLTHCYTCCYNMTSSEGAKRYSDQRLGEGD